MCSQHIMTCCVTVSVEMSRSIVWGNLWSQDCNISTEWRKTVFHRIPTKLLNISKTIWTPAQRRWSSPPQSVQSWAQTTQHLVKKLKLNLYFNTSALHSCIVTHSQLQAARTMDGLLNKPTGAQVCRPERSRRPIQPLVWSNSLTAKRC